MHPHRRYGRRTVELPKAVWLVNSDDVYQSEAHAIEDQAVGDGDTVKIGLYRLVEIIEITKETKIKRQVVKS
jgi:hypothetical protein